MINKKDKIFSEFEFQFFFSFEMSLLKFFYYNQNEENPVALVLPTSPLLGTEGAIAADGGCWRISGLTRLMVLGGEGWSF